MFQQRHQIDVPFFENGPLGQVHLVHHEVGLVEVQDVEPARDLGQLGQKTADQTVGFASETQIETGRLDLPVFDRYAGVDGAARDQLLDLLVGQYALCGSGAHRSSCSTVLHDPSEGPVPTIGSSRADPCGGCG